MNITMLGTSRSGKTAFMSGLYETLCVNSLAGFGLETASEVSNILISNQDLQAISFHKLGYKFPDSTIGTTLWPFILTHGKKQVTGFEWIDYRGGVIDDIRSSMDDPKFKDELTEIQGHILASNALMLFADSIRLTEYDNIRLARRFAGVDQITQVMKNYSREYGNRNLTFLVVLSKVDAIRSEWKVNDYQPLIQRGREAFTVLKDLCNDNVNWRGGIVAVSAVGEGKARTKITQGTDLQTPLESDSTIVDAPEPLHVGQALFYCVGQTLARMENYSRGEIAIYEDQLRKALAKSNIFTSVWAKITRRQSPAEIAREIVANKERTVKALQEYAPYVKPICDIANCAVQSFP